MCCTARFICRRSFRRTRCSRRGCENCTRSWHSCCFSRSWLISARCCSTRWWFAMGCWDGWPCGRLDLAMPTPRPGRPQPAGSARGARGWNALAMGERRDQEVGASGDSGKSEEGEADLGQRQQDRPSRRRTAGVAGQGGRSATFSRGPSGDTSASRSGGGQGTRHAGIDSNQAGQPRARNRQSVRRATADVALSSRGLIGATCCRSAGPRRSSSPNATGARCRRCTGARRAPPRRTRPRRHRAASPRADRRMCGHRPWGGRR